MQNNNENIQSQVQEKKAPNWVSRYIIFAIGLMCFEITIYATYYIFARDAIDVSDPRYVNFSNIAYVTGIIWPLVAIICFIAWVKEFGINTYPGKVSLLLTIGIIIWSFADWYYPFQWFFYLSEEYPENNPARYLYTIGYFLFVIALFMQLKVAKTKLTKNEKITLGLTWSLVTILSIIYVFAPIIQEELSEDVTIFTKIFLILFSTLDLVIIMLTTLLVYRYRGGQFSRAWLLISIGFLITAGFDLLNVSIGYFAYSPYSYLITDHIYYLIYVFFSVGALYFHRLLKSVEA